MLQLEEQNTLLKTRSQNLILIFIKTHLLQFQLAEHIFFFFLGEKLANTSAVINSKKNH